MNAQLPLGDSTDAPTIPKGRVLVSNGDVLLDPLATPEARAFFEREAEAEGGGRGGPFIDPNFDWTGALVLFREQPALAVYTDPDHNLIVRQRAAWNEEADSVVIIAPENAQAFVDRVCDALGIGSAP